jgi:hypothetical protein
LYYEVYFQQIILHGDGVMGEVGQRFDWFNVTTSMAIGVLRFGALKAIWAQDRIYPFHILLVCSLYLESQVKAHCIRLCRYGDRSIEARLHYKFFEALANFVS